MSEIVVLGAGMAGYGAAHKLKSAGVDLSLYEKKNHIGGHCASYVFDDQWVFDDGPHISFSKIEHVKKIFAENIDHDYFEFEANVDNYWKGKWIKHPAQVNLKELPAALNTQIMMEMIAAHQEKDPVINNYQDWLYASYGKTFSENFPMKYTRKFHTTDAINLSTDWLGPRLYKPQLSEVIYGMLSQKTEDVHYIKAFRYPNKGGFVSLMNGIHDVADIQFEHDVVSINLQKKELTFQNNKKVDYKYCFSSLPLKKIISLIEDAPQEIREAADKLAYTQCVLVNIGVNRSNLSPAHWRYVYDEDFYTTRISFPSMFGPGNTPPGAGSIQVEIYFSDKYKPLDRKPEDFIPIVKDELIHMGILNPLDKILIEKAWVSPFAQIIYDHDRKENVELLHAFLKENDIFFGGRFADWSYCWSDESFLRGEEAAEEILSKLAVTI
ncbi:protoporphyrinogen/coproporphyrinogen oxidase [Pararhodonellum marinum]|uniref:protoporphyrinogen/coproporphyrinogen oxidase n=1 Tax=Pararhodonellum marinum TaxID=2755358 RepID=UPI00188E78A9|nr:FAD-dependent oxidoreductase [Pararhodonellum marinum]